MSETWLLEQIEADRQRALQLEGHDPQRHRALVDCDMLEQIIRQHVDWQTTLDETPPDRTEGECTTYRMAMEWTVHRVAMMFDDRPGWEEHWGWVRGQVESWARSHRG